MRVADVVADWAGEQVSAWGGGVQVVVDVGDETVALVRGTRTDGGRLEPTTPMLLFSAAKPFVATCVHLLVQDGALSYGDPVARYLPAFAAGGKQDVTLTDLLVHRGGFPDAQQAVWVESFVDWPTALSKVCGLDVDPVLRGLPVYHPLTGAAVLAGVVEAITAAPFPKWCAEHVFLPSGMTSTSWGRPDGADDTVGVDPVCEQELRRWRLPDVATAVIPGGNAYSTALDLVRFYRKLPALLTSESLRMATSLAAPWSPGGTFGFSMGFFAGRDVELPGSRGTSCSEQAYGHPGMCSTLGLHDPVYEVTIAAVCNRAPTQEQSDRRFADLCDRVFAAVGERQVQ